MSANHANDAQVIRLVERCLEVMEHSGTQIVDDLLLDHPEHAEAVRARLTLLTETGMVDSEGGSADRAGWVNELENVTEAEEEAEAFPEVLGDFRLLERIGRGGMGVVYRANQESLGRDVALKLITPGHLYFPGAHRRFRREVEAVARLDHPGIVSIHVVGEDCGIPYFAMDYVPGRSLSAILEDLGSRRPEQLAGADLLRVAAGEVLAESSGSSSDETDLYAMSWVDACLTVALQVGEALAHAHERGVLHRDVKPSNIMIKPDGRARVLDFGLAWSEGTTPLTRSGSQMGSLPYMAPEQVRGEGESIDARTDVYALGVTLYELLTLRSPFWAENSERTRQRILDGQPASMDGLNSSVTWDAETVCLTAMELDAGRRYPTMQALVDDLRRLLQRQAIHARRSGIVLRARRWAQRNPARAATAVLGALVVVGGLIGYDQLQRAAQSDLRKAFDRENAQRLRADRRLEDAIKAIDEMLDQGSDPELAARPGADPSRRRMLERALVLYQDLLEREGENRVITMRIISAQIRVSHITSVLGDLESATKAARRAMALCGELVESDEKAAQIAVSMARFALLNALFNSNEIDEFRRVQADQAAEPVAEDPRAEFEQTQRRAVGLRILASVQQREGEIDAAIASAGKSVDLCAGLVKRNPKHHGVLASMALALHLKAYFAGYHGRDAEYGETLQRAVDLLEKALKLDPRSPSHRHRLARALSGWAHLELRNRRYPEAAARAKRADGILSTLVREFPMRESYCVGHLSNAQRLAWAFRMGGEKAKGESVLAASIDAGKARLTRLPQSAGLVYHIAMFEAELAMLMGWRGAFETADPLWAAARLSWQKLVDRPKRSIIHTAQVGVFFDNLARYQLKRRDGEAAEASVRSALKWHHHMLKRTGSVDHKNRVSKSLPLLARIQVLQGRHEEAVATLRSGVDEGFLNRLRVSYNGLADQLGSREDYRKLRARTPVDLPPRKTPAQKPRR